MKKVLSIILAMTMILAVVPLGIFTASADYQNGDYTYSLDGNNATITDYTGTGGDISIPEIIDNHPVVTIGTYAFWKKTTITSVIIPTTVTSLDYGAFEACSSITSVDIPDSVKTIGLYAFSECSSLQDIIIPSSVTTIYIDAFRSCYMLSTAIFTGNAPVIYDQIFSDCRYNFSIYYPSGSSGWTSPWSGYSTKAFDLKAEYKITYDANGAMSGVPPVDVGSYTFGQYATASNIGDLKKTNYEFIGWCTRQDGNGTKYAENSKIFIKPENITLYAIWAQDLTEGNRQQMTDDAGNTWTYTPIGTKLCRIDDCATENESITVPNIIDGRVVYALGIDAISFISNLKSITIGINMQNIQLSSLYGLRNLTEIIVDENNDFYKSVDGVLFNKLETTLIKYPEGKQGGYTVPNSVKTIAYGAISYCSSLTDISIGISVKEIGSAFYNCPLLTSITVDENNTLFSSQDGVLYNKDNTAIISCPASRMGSYVIPDSVKTIGDSAFRGCVGLNSIIIPNKVETIGRLAFTECGGLQNISIPASVTAIGDYAFEECRHLSKAIFLGNAPTVGYVIFLACAEDFTIYYKIGASGWSTPWNDYSTVEYNSNITYTLTYDANGSTGGTVPKDESSYSIGSIAKVATNSGGLTKSYYEFKSWNTEPDGSGTDYAEGSTIFILKSNIRLYAVWYQNLTEGEQKSYTAAGVTWNYTQIGSGLCRIEGCSTISGNFTVPNVIDGRQVYSIYYKAFINQKELTGITIGADVKDINPGAFSGCVKLAQITVNANNPNYSSLDGVLFDKNKTRTYKYPEGKAGSYVIPNTVIYVGSEFQDCKLLTSVTIGYGVSYVMDVFNGCTSLSQITVNTSNKYLASQDGILFDRTRTTVIRCPQGKAGSYTIPSTVTNISADSFMDCVKITGITMGSSVTLIDYEAFKGCTELTTLTIGSKVNSIGDNAFMGCKKLTAITIPDSVTDIGNDAFLSCINLTQFIVGANNKMFSVLNGVLFNKDKTQIVKYPEAKAGSFVIPNSVTGIGFEFSYCRLLTSVTLGSGISEIYIPTFSHCPMLTQISVDANNKYFSSVNGVLLYNQGKYLVKYPEGKMGSFSVPGSVTRLYTYAFSSCNNLTGLYIGNNVTTIDDIVFSDCSKLTIYGETGFYAEGYATRKTLSFVAGSLPGAPPVPMNIKAAAKTDKTISLSWSPVPGASWYNVYINSLLVATVTTTTYTAVNLAPNTTYNIAVKGMNNGGESLSGTISSITDCTPPVSPTGLKAVSAGYNSVKLTWAEVSGASGYYIYRLSGNTYSLIYTVTSGKILTYTNASLICGTAYAYKIAAYKTGTNGNKKASGLTGYVSAKPIPATPLSFAVARASSSSIKISWAAVAGASGYTVYRYNSSTKKYVAIVNVTSLSYINTKLTKNVTYNYMVAAYRTVGSAKVYSVTTAVKSAKPY